ncbi:MAG TPA: hypothetical protein VFV63_10295 [Ilumatobacteraceae bacterium]|nr:hypothetical protein [Ilumatobacteraceae bacterium]
MSDPMKQAWNDVGEGFSMLGRMMKERYQTADAGGADDAAAAASAQDDDALRAAFAKLLAAGREFSDRAVDVARDDDVKAQAKRVAASLNDAVTATVDLIGEHVDGLFNRSRGHDSTSEESTSKTLPTKPASDD